MQAHFPSVHARSKLLLSGSLVSSVYVEEPPNPP